MAEKERGREKGDTEVSEWIKIDQLKNVVFYYETGNALYGVILLEASSVKSNFVVLKFNHRDMLRIATSSPSSLLVHATKHTIARHQCESILVAKIVLFLAAAMILTLFCRRCFLALRLCCMWWAWRHPHSNSLVGVGVCVLVCRRVRRRHLVLSRSSIFSATFSVTRQLVGIDQLS